MCNSRKYPYLALSSFVCAVLFVFHFVILTWGTNIKLLHFHLLFSRVPLADFHDAKHTTRSMYLDLTKGRLLTCGGDRIVKVRNNFHLEVLNVKQTKILDKETVNFERKLEKAIHIRRQQPWPPDWKKNEIIIKLEVTNG